MPKNIVIIFLITNLTGCISFSNTITVRKDGSAFVETIREEDNIDLERYKSTNIISNIDTTKYYVTFEISNIDSLGNYLPYLQRGFMQFKLDSNVFKVTDGNTMAFNSSLKDKSCNCCGPMGVDTYIKFEQDILEAEGETSYAYYSKKNRISILKSKRQLIKNKGKVNLTVKLDLGIADTLD